MSFCSGGLRIKDFFTFEWTNFRGEGQSGKRWYLKSHSELYFFGSQSSIVDSEIVDSSVEIPVKASAKLANLNRG